MPLAAPSEDGVAESLDVAELSQGPCIGRPVTVAEYARTSAEHYDGLSDTYTRARAYLCGFSSKDAVREEQQRIIAIEEKIDKRK